MKMRSANPLWGPILFAVVALCSAGCSARARYDQPDPYDGVLAPPQLGDSQIRLAPVAESQRLRLSSSMSRMGGHDQYPVLRFDLSPVPDDARVRRAVVRLRRADVSWDEPAAPPAKIAVRVVDVNHGLRIHTMWWGAAGDDSIETAARTDDEDALWALVASDEGERRHAIELAGATYAGSLYGDLLLAWNLGHYLNLLATGAWDELDITELVEGQLGADRSLTLLIMPVTEDVTVRWFGSDVERGFGRSLPNHPNFCPHLVVEYDAASAVEPGAD